jgi:hypothetical protein
MKIEFEYAYEDFRRPAVRVGGWLIRSFYRKLPGIGRPLLRFLLSLAMIICGSVLGLLYGHFVCAIPLLLVGFVVFFLIRGIGGNDVGPRDAWATHVLNAHYTVTLDPHEIELAGPYCSYAIPWDQATWLKESEQIFTVGSTAMRIVVPKRVLAEPVLTDRFREEVCRLSGREFES